jgi:formate hydrogenlyase transcriptional activator
MRGGALEFLTKPFDNKDLLNAIELGIARDRRARHGRREISQHHFEEIVGVSGALRAVLQQVEVVALTSSTVLILGETGTGKELIARAVHNISSRSNRPFVKLNCAAIPSGLLESELFGHERGAFTGAVAQKIGRFELAHGGTLFLDEVGDIPLELQPKLLRVLQEGEFERLGSTRTQHIDVRLVAATNRHLAQLVAEREFREDLYFRLNVFPIRIPPLRERAEDIPLLVRHFVDLCEQRMNKHIETIPDEVLETLCCRSWPGNIRELQNFIERAMILCTGTELRLPMVELEDRVEKPAASTLEEAERQHILRILEETKWVIGGVRGAASRLGVKRTTLLSKMERLGISRH